MATDTSDTALIVGAVAAAWLLLRSPAAPTPAGSLRGEAGARGIRAPAPRPADGGAWGVFRDVEHFGGAAIPLLGAAGLGGGLAAAGVGVVAASAAVGYAAEGTPGAILGGLNPAGAVGAVTARGAQEAVKAAGGNAAAQGTATAGGFALGAVATVGEIAAAAALLPTLLIAVGIGELVGLILGQGGPPPELPIEQQIRNQVEALFALATNSGPASFVLHPSDSDRIHAAAQLVAWANGPEPVPGIDGGPFLTVPPQHNLRRQYARERIPQLGLNSLLK